MKRIFYLLFLNTISVNVSAESTGVKPIVESFENAKALAQYKSSSKTVLSVTDEHYVMGKQSLKWEWKNAKSSFGTGYFSPIPYNAKNTVYDGIFKSSPNFMFSIYSEKPQAGDLKISFYKNGKEEVWFNVLLGFSGWRRLLVPFHAMQGNKPLTTTSFDFDYVQITANASKGTLYFDDIIFSKYFDDRFAAPDGICPFVNDSKKESNHHGLDNLSNMKLLQQLKMGRPTEGQIKEVELIEARIKQKLLPGAVKYDMASLQQRFAAMGIFQKGKTVKGPPLAYPIDEFYVDSLLQGPKKYNEIRPFGMLMLDVAKAYATTLNIDDKQELLKMFLLGSDYFIDQGWQQGAWNINIGVVFYATREVIQAFYIMKEQVYNAGIMPQIEGSLQWISNYGRMLNDDKSVDVDFINTLSFGCLLISLFTNDKTKQVALLNAYSHYMSIILAQEEKAEGFRPDGTVWHHAGHYPAYGTGAFSTMSSNMYLLSGTSFKIKEAGHENYKKALMATATYTQWYNWGFSNAGRHPFATNSIDGLKNAYLELARSGDPKGTDSIDLDVASAYMRLWKDDNDNVALFAKRGVQPRQMPGYTSFPYASMAVHRRNEWAAIIKGYSKYVWASEIYDASNRYGRYPSNGTIQLLNKGGDKESGFVQEGWDWNRYPGATVIHLPFEKLESPKPLLMFLSQQSFAGVATLDNNNGVFGFILDESKGSNADGVGEDRSIGFDGKLKAKKSVFSFGDKLICIGTDISATDKTYPVQTNLFQTFLKDSSQVVYTDAAAIKDFPVNKEVGKRVIDPLGNGYYVLSSQNIQMHKKRQLSYLATYSVNNGAKKTASAVKNTEGNFASAWIDHGTAPGEASCQYVIYPFMTLADQQKFKAKTEADSSTYKIIRADAKAHIVLDKITNTTGYVFFESGRFDDALVKEVSDPSILMLQQNDENRFTLGAVQPDLNFSKGNDTRSGFKAYSEPVTLTITLNGKWGTGSHDFVQSVKWVQNTTIITMRCQHGVTNTMVFKKL